MKKLYSFMLIVITLFSCVLFSACGDKFKDLQILIYSESGKELNQIDYIIDNSLEQAPVKIRCDFKNIDKEDVGQILVYSIPNELISNVKYTYNDSSVNVQFEPMFPSGSDAKLVVAHLSSGTKKELPLNVGLKSNGLNVENSTYYVDIPKLDVSAEPVVKYIDLSKCVQLSPSVSTDKVYFKIKSSLPSAVTGNPVKEFEGMPTYEGCCDGFVISDEITEEFDVEIYPVTYMKDHKNNDDVNKYQNKTITVQFKNLLKDSNVELSSEGFNSEILPLIVKDDKLSYRKFGLFYKTEREPVSLADTEYFDLYNIDLHISESGDKKINAVTDSQNDIIISAISPTESVAEVKVVLTPINNVGEIKPVELVVKVTAESKPDDISVKKDGKIIDITQSADVFDYFKNPNTIGTRFNFTPTSKYGDVAPYLSQMRIVINPEILNADATSADSTLNVIYTDDTFSTPNSTNEYGGKTVRSKKFVLSIYKSTETLKFYYDEGVGQLISETFSKNDSIYVKYLDGNLSGEKAKNFGFDIKTLNTSDVEIWEDDYTGKTVQLKLREVKGVKSITLGVGEIIHNVGGGYSLNHQSYTKDDYEQIYLNRKTSPQTYVYVKTAKGLDDNDINSSVFDVSVSPKGFSTANPLKISDTKLISNVDNLTIDWVKDSDDGAVVIRFNQNTAIGEYDITFSQNGTVLDIITCKIYEAFDTAIGQDNVLIPTSDKLFKNVDYTGLYKSDYIVASGVELESFVLDLDESVINSGVYLGYTHSVDVGYDDGAWKSVDNPLIYAEKTGMGVNFKQGTVINGEKRYVKLTITVNYIQYHPTQVDLVGSGSKTINIIFFVYEEINKSDVSFDVPHLEVQPAAYSGYYYSNMSSKTLTVNLTDSNLWNYTTESSVVWHLDGEPISGNSSSVTGVEYSIYNNTGTFTFKSHDYFHYEIKAYIKQFDDMFEVYCPVVVTKPILTETIKVESKVYMAEGLPYINLKMNESYQVEATNESSKGIVTHPEFIIQVFNQDGSSFNVQEYFYIDQINSTIKVKSIDRVNNYKLVVFAKDVLKDELAFDIDGYNNLKNFILDDGLINSLYNFKNSYYEVDILVSEGTAERPYLINDAIDFWQLGEQAYSTAHWKLMTDIVVNNDNKVIELFAGKLTTFNNNVYCVDGMELSETNKNLFSEIAASGEISNVKFIVNYNYNLESENDEYLGVIKENQGVLTNVFVEVYGSATLTTGENNNHYFGALIGKNAGTLKYDSGVGSLGLIDIHGSENIYFGGLVGYNAVQIIGCEETQNGGENIIVLTSSQGRANAMSLLTINSDFTNRIEGNAVYGGVGGVVGYNTGVIRNAYVQAKINASETSNVGGVIGVNAFKLVEILVEKYDKENQNDIGFDYTKNNEDLQNASIYNVVSSSMVVAKNNVGGIVGKDIYGRYIECDYQIYKQNNNTAMLTGDSYVGGIAGRSEYGKFLFCSVMSYKWTYDTTDVNKGVYKMDSADIVAANYVGGIVGNAIGEEFNINDPNGTNNDNKNVTIISCGVNAYLKSDDNVGGILASTQGTSLMYASYFIGRIDGTLNTSEGANYTDLTLDNIGNYHRYNLVYTVCLYNGTIKTGSYFNQDEWNYYNEDPSSEYWYLKNNINGGYTYITTDKDGNDGYPPIFDLAPTKVSAEVTGETKEALKKILRLDYYDFSINEYITDAKLKELNDTHNNNQSVLDKLTITAEPAGLGTVMINVLSSNTSLLDMSADGRFVIKGKGECELKISSVLNPGAETTIKVIIDYPIGDFKIRNNKRVLEPGAIEVIPKNSSVLYSVASTGNVDGYAYRTKQDICLDVEVVDSGLADVTDYVNISGNKTNSNVKLDETTPFILSVIEHYSSEFTVTVVPFVKINGEEVYFVEETSFKLSTIQGATNVVFSYDNAIVYPNDTVTLNANFITDNLISDIANKFSFGIETGYTIGELTRNGDVCVYEILKNSVAIGYVSLKIIDSNEVQDYIQKTTLIIEFSDMEISEELSLELKCTAGNSYKSVNYTILPQRINKIDIKNYSFSETTDDWVLENVLKPSHVGKIQIDLVPDNGYYDYLEISDITGNEEIVFIQIKEDEYAVPNRDISSDGKGIKLYKIGDASRLYVTTQIDGGYTSKLHTIQVRAYSANRTLLASFNKEIDVKMLPGIQVTHVLPDGKNGTTAKTSENITALYLANGVDANFRIETFNADNGEISWTLSGDVKNNYALENVVDNQYILKYVGSGVKNSDLNKKLTINFKLTNTLPNGDAEVAECSMEFIIASFVIHDISVNSSIDSISKQEIYGYYGKAIDLDFYFDENDISFYDASSNSDKFWSQQYAWDPNYATKHIEGTDLYNIYAILDELNNTNSSNYIKLTEATNINQKIALDNTIITVSKDYDTNSQLEVDLSFKNNVTEWILQDPASTGANYRVEKSYELNFVDSTKWYEPTVVDSEADFKNMKSGVRYLLNKDLTLNGYVPIDADLLEFDGNGHTIEIQSFGSFDEPELKAGLFKKVYENMVVKNVKVIYNSERLSGNYALGKVDRGVIEYSNICNNSEVAYSSVDFGGITAENNGVITNCVVEGLIAIHASVIEQTSSSGNYEIDFNIGGMVSHNAKIGYITNSVSNLKIYSLANIGGFAYENQGVIASSKVGTDAIIYGYNNNLSNTINIQTAGFVVKNASKVSMSAVELGDEGLMSSKDTSAGFVYNNTGNITDAYMKMNKFGVNNNRFAGFVYENGGNITRAYVLANEGKLTDSEDAMFVKNNSGQILDSIQFVNEVKTDAIEGLHSKLISKASYKETYVEYHFAFGDNESAVWFIDGNAPKLVAIEENNFDLFNKLGIMQEPDSNPNDGVDEIIYKPNFANYGTKQNPYIIKDIESWNDYFNPENNPEMTGYYRIVKDIDFSVVGGNPSTSSLIFKGNIQGNNMELKKIMLYSKNSLDSIGLFEKLEGCDDVAIKNSVRNLKLSTTSVWASGTKAVGILAGIIENFNIYNIEIDSEEVVMVGKNAVGGLAGVVRGEFDLDLISSNISANSTRTSTQTSYSIYMSINNKKSASYNLADVYYSGSIVAILDGYKRNTYNVSDSRDINVDTYYMVRNINVKGKIGLVGDTVGVAFGLVGERVYVDDVNIDISGTLSGSQYSAGIAGENRGVISNSNVKLADDIFNYSESVSAGIVGFNLGGLVIDSTAEADIKKDLYLQVVGGIVGRNVYGTVTKAFFNGELEGHFVGGIVGVNYNHNQIKGARSGSGSLNNDCSTNKYLIPQNQVSYKLSGSPISNLEDVSLSLSTMEYFINTSSDYYSYEGSNIANLTLNNLIVRNKVLGLVVGLSYETDNIVSIQSYKYEISISNKDVKFNSSATSSVEYIDAENEIELVKNTALEPNDNSIKVTLTEFNQLKLASAKNDTYIIYLVGAQATSFDSWNSYSDHYVVVSNVDYTTDPST